jgi:hypothetical protein
MRFALPHSLGKDEARRRIKSRSHELAGFMPGGVAEVSERWSNEDRLELAIAAMGQTVAASIEVAEAEIAFEVALPPALSFFEPMVRSAIEAKGRKLLT